MSSSSRVRRSPWVTVGAVGIAAAAGTRPPACRAGSAAAAQRRRRRSAHARAAIAQHAGRITSDRSNHPPRRSASPRWRRAKSEVTAFGYDHHHGHPTGTRHLRVTSRIVRWSAGRARTEGAPTAPGSRGGAADRWRRRARRGRWPRRWRSVGSSATVSAQWVTYRYGAGGIVTGMPKVPRYRGRRRRDPPTGRNARASCTRDGGGLRSLPPPELAGEPQIRATRPGRRAVSRSVRRGHNSSCRRTVYRTIR